jgi:FkbM family methyltransferase
MQARKPLHYFVLAAVFVCTGLFSGWLVTPPLNRSRLYAAGVELWILHWPFSAGQTFPVQVSPTLYRIGIVRPVRLEMEPRVSLLLDPADFIDRRIFLNGDWERGLWSWMESHLTPGGSFVDIGAHMGVHSLRAAKAVGDNGRVVSIEPNPVTAARLRANIAASGWRNMEVRQVACADAAGKLKLFAGGPANTGTASLSRENALGWGGGGQSFEVDVVTLDEILKTSPLTRIQVIKIDTEGAETRILRGAGETLRKHRPAIVLETVEEHLHNMNSSLQELEALLLSLGYRKSRFDEANAEWLPASDRAPGPSDGPAATVR